MLRSIAVIVLVAVDLASLAARDLLGPAMRELGAVGRSARDLWRAGVTLRAQGRS